MFYYKSKTVSIRRQKRKDDETWFIFEFSSNNDNNNDSYILIEFIIKEQDQKFNIHDTFTEYRDKQTNFHLSSFHGIHEVDTYGLDKLMEEFQDNRSKYEAIKYIQNLNSQTYPKNDVFPDPRMKPLFISTIEDHFINCI